MTPEKPNTKTAKTASKKTEMKASAKKSPMRAAGAGSKARGDKTKK